MELLKRFYAINSKSGHEGAVKALFMEQIAGLELAVEEDAFGNVFITKGAADSYPGVTAHLDEVHAPTERNIVVDGDMIYAFCFDHMGDVIAYGYDYQGRRDCLEVEYNGFGYPSIVSTRCGSEDVKSTYLRYDYDMAADGRILRVEVMGECNYTAHYYYDDAKRLRQATKMERYSDDIMTLVKSYDVDGNLVRLELLDGVEVMYCLMYDYSAPDTLERVVREVSGMVDYFDEYLYSEGGRGLVVTRRGIYGEEYQRVEFEFDGVGNITKMVTTPGRYSDVDVVTFDIEYYE